MCIKQVAAGLSERANGYSDSDVSCGGIWPKDPYWDDIIV